MDFEVRDAFEANRLQTMENLIFSLMLLRDGLGQQPSLAGLLPKVSSVATRVVESKGEPWREELRL